MLFTNEKPWGNPREKAGAMIIKDLRNGTSDDGYD